MKLSSVNFILSGSRLGKTEVLINLLALLQETPRGIYDEFSGFQVLMVFKIITIFLENYFYHLNILGTRFQKSLFIVLSNHYNF